MHLHLHMCRHLRTCLFLVLGAAATLTQASISPPDSIPLAESELSPTFIVLFRDGTPPHIIATIQEQMVRPDDASNGAGAGRRRDSYPRLNHLYNDAAFMLGFSVSVRPTNDSVSFTGRIVMPDGNDDADVGNIENARSFIHLGPDGAIPQPPPCLAFLAPYMAWVSLIERSTMVSPNAVLGNEAGMSTEFGASATSATVFRQNGATWNLNRISERRNHHNDFYLYDGFQGSNVDCYVIDSGIHVGNQAFQGRASVGYDLTGEGPEDILGHGTHVAGIIGSLQYGVAKQVNLIGVKVIGSSGVTDWATVLAAINWVYRQHKSSGHARKSIVNMSLGGVYSLAITRGIGAMVESGIPVVVAAGNDAQNACGTSPSACPAAIVVAATTDADGFWPESNFGPCVDLCAPGDYILSTYIGSDTATAYMAGTSMASPHVAGMLALTWSKYPFLKADQLTQYMLNCTTIDAISGMTKGEIYPTGNRLLFSLV